MKRTAYGVRRSHDELAQQLTVLLSQLVYGRHGPTRMQLLNACGVLRAALPFITTDDALGLARPTEPWIREMLEKIGGDVLEKGPAK